MNKEIVVISIDTDWAPVEVVEYSLNLLEKYNISATYFLTNQINLDLILVFLTILVFLKISSYKIIFAGFFYDPYYLTVFAKVLTINFILEFILYFVGIHQLAKPLQFIDFCLWFIIHIPYIVLMGIGSFFANQLIWRER